jgi:hypothetical protein
MKRLLRALPWVALLFAINVFIWWTAQRSPWWSWAIFITAGMVLSHTDKDIRAWWRKRRRQRNVHHLEET